MQRVSSLNLLYPPFLVRFVKGLKNAQDAGFPVKEFETFRSFERQDHLYSLGRTKKGKIVTNARAGRSFHQYGIASDIAMFINGQWTWTDPKSYVAVAPYFEKEGLQWLGRKSNDLTHYQLKVEFSIYELENIYKTENLLGVWTKLNERYGDHDIWKTLQT